MKVLIVGASSGGAKVAAKLKRELGHDVQIDLITKGEQVAYNSCAIPSFLSGTVANYDDLIDLAPDDYSSIVDVNIHPCTRAIKLNRTDKQITVEDIASGSVRSMQYDKLVIATGAFLSAPVLQENKLENVYQIGSLSEAKKMREALVSGTVRRAVVFGSSTDAIETAFAISSTGARCSIITSSAHILPDFDTEYAEFIENQLAELGIPVLSNDCIESLEGTEKLEKIRTSKRAIKADLLVFADSQLPQTQWLSDSGLEMAENGALVVNEYLQTSDPHIFACGSCATGFDAITKEQIWTTQSELFHHQGRLLAKVISGSASHGIAGSLQTQMLILPSLYAGKTGLSFELAKAKAIDAESITITTDDKAKYYPGKESYMLRIIAERTSRKLLGMQVICKNPVDKLIDIAATALSLGATLDQIEAIHFANKPAVSSPIHPFSIAVYSLQNKLDGKLHGNCLSHLNIDDSWVLIDSGKKPIIPKLRYIPTQSINDSIPDIPSNAKIAILCAGGRWSYLTENRLRRYGYTDVHSIEGGSLFNYRIDDFVDELLK